MQLRANTRPRHRNSPRPAEKSAKPASGLEQSRSSTRAVHTPGPWYGDGEPFGAIKIYRSEGLNIGEIYWTQGEDQECRANARLAAAAPDLYEAGELALEYAIQCRSEATGDEEGRQIDRDIAKIEAALAKARGDA